MSHLLRKLAALAAVLTAGFVLAACGGDEQAREPARSTASDGAEFNEADVAFATDMIQRHAQALAMVDLTIGRRLDPEVQQLAESIREAQGPEIELMADWLTDWGEPIPETTRDHVNAEGHGDTDTSSDLPAMVSAQDMAELEAASGDDFQQRWLETMVEHHEGAIARAETQQSEGLFPPAVELADGIIESQQDEVATMQGLLES